MTDHTPDAGASDARTRGVSRRQSLRGGTGVAAATALLAASTEAVAASEHHAGSKPNHVTIQYDEAWLNQYRPYLDLSGVPLDNRPALYGWRVSSPEEDTEVAVYAAGYAVQRDHISLTSHAGDHEWIYVHVDSATGDVVEVDYAAYHWLRGYVTNPTVHGTGGEQHVSMVVAPTYHHYLPASEVSSSSVLLDVSSLGDYSSQSGPLYQWLQNGMGADLAVGSVHNPWTINADGPLDAWWSDTRSGRVNKNLVEAWAFINTVLGVGIRGGDTVDFGEVDA